MSHFRAGRCPGCRSENITVVAAGNPSTQAGIRLALLAALGFFLAGFLLTPGADLNPNFDAFVSGLQFLSRWVVVPAAVIVWLVYFLGQRGFSKKRVCRDCGKKWKVRSRSRAEEKTEASGQPG